LINQKRFAARLAGRFLDEAWIKNRKKSDSGKLPHGRALQRRGDLREFNPIEIGHKPVSHSAVIETGGVVAAVSDHAHRAVAARPRWPDKENPAPPSNARAVTSMLHPSLHDWNYTRKLAVN
jgi:hypothetical protein